MMTMMTMTVMTKPTSRVLGGGKRWVVGRLYCSLSLVFVGPCGACYAENYELLRAGDADIIAQSYNMSE